MNITRKYRPSLSDLDRFNNFCKAMAEQELLEAGVFQNARDAEDVRSELTRDDRLSGAKIIEMKCIDAAGNAPVKKPKWEEMDEITGRLADAVSRQGHSIGSSYGVHREEPAAARLDDKGSLKSPPKNN